MKIEHRGRKPKIKGVKEKVFKLVEAGYSYQEISNKLKMSGRALARYHFLTYLNKVVGIKRGG